MVQNEFCEEELPSNTTLISLIISALKSSLDELLPPDAEPSLREFESVFEDVFSLADVGSSKSCGVRVEVLSISVGVHSLQTISILLFQSLSSY